MCVKCGTRKGVFVAVVQVYPLVPLPEDTRDFAPIPLEDIGICGFCMTCKKPRRNEILSLDVKKVIAQLYLNQFNREADLNRMGLGWESRIIENGAPSNTESD